VAFRHEASELFEEMLKSIEDEIVKFFYRVRITVEIAPVVPVFRNVHLGRGALPGTASQSENQPPKRKKPEGYHKLKQRYRVKRR